MSGDSDDQVEEFLPSKVTLSAATNTQKKTAKDAAQNNFLAALILTGSDQ